LDGRSSAFEPIFRVTDKSTGRTTVMDETLKNDVKPDHANAQRHRSEAGMTTAEYTVGTLGACSVAAVLIKIAQTPWFGDLVKGLLENITGIAGF
jgi:hypothetical protein